MSTNNLVRALLLLIASAMALGMAAQKNRNYIYVFDCTQSMQTSGLWEQANRSLQRTIRNHSVEPKSQVAVVPFQNNAYDAITFAAKDYTDATSGVGKAVRDAFEKYVATRTNTNIIAALEAGERQIRPGYDNRLYIFTDGQDTRVKAEGVAKYMREWCGKYPDTRLFYIMLHQSAVDGAIVSVAETCRDIYVVQPAADGSIPEFVEISPSRFNTSTLELDRRLPLEVAITQPMALEVRCDDPVFDVVVEGGKAEGGQALLKVSPRQNLDTPALNAVLEELVDEDGNYEFGIAVESPDPGVRIINPAVQISVANRQVRQLVVLQGSTTQLNMAEHSASYPGFLFWGEKLPDTLSVPLEPVFNQAAAADGSRATFRVADLGAYEGGHPDYTLLYRGRELQAGEPFTVSPGEDGSLQLVFSPEARTGERQFELQLVQHNGIEQVNNIPVDEIDHRLAFATEYSRNRNPLALALIIFGLILVAALALWFWMIKPYRYPKIKISSIEITNPKPFYVKKKILGARRVVLTGSPFRQSGLSRIFTGRIIVIQGEHWGRDRIIIDAASKKRVRFRCTGGWATTPTTTFRKGESGRLSYGGDSAKTSEISF